MADEDLRERLKRARPLTFKPVPVYFEDGDRVDFYWKDVLAYTESLQYDGRAVGEVHKAMVDTTRFHCATSTPPTVTVKDEIVGISINMEALRATSFVKLTANIIGRMTDGERKELRKLLEDSGETCMRCFRKLKPENGEDCDCHEADYEL